MEQHPVRRPRRATALFLVALAAVGLTSVPPTGAVEDVTPERIAGATRFETAAAVAAAAFPTGSDTVLVASGRAFPDALAGAALGFPVLLTEQDSLPGATAQAIDDLGAASAIILGGTAAVSADVADEIATHATVDRIAGTDRYETAADIATSVGAANVGTISGKKTAIVATGLGFADALAGGPLATGGDDTLPIVLVAESTPGPTAQALDDLGIEQVLILGGNAAVSPAVQTQLEVITGNDAIRLAGANRYGTAVAIAEFAIGTLGFPADQTLLASGADFADALAGGPLGGVRQAPLLLTDPVQLPDESKAFFVDHADTIDTVTTLGGTAAVSTSAADAAEAAAETPPASGVNETIAVTPKVAANVANTASRDFTVTGLGTTAVDIVLVTCGYVTTSSSGDTVFANTNLNLQADGGSDAPDGGSSNTTDEANTRAYFTKINGDAQQRDEAHKVFDDDYADDVAPNGGKVTFSVSGPSGNSASECIVPVVFDDANSDDTLNVNGTNPSPPTEDFGTGGPTTFSPSAATNGAIFDVDTSSNDDASNRFVGCDNGRDDAPEITDPTECHSYLYDDNDLFQIRSATTTLAAFEAALTAGDDVHGTFNADPVKRSVFNLFHDEAPEPPDASSAQKSSDASSITIKFSDSSRATVDSYRLYRVTKDVTCPAETTYSPNTFTLVGSVDDPALAKSDTTKTASITDRTVTQGVTYCYYLISVDDGDEGPASKPIEASASDTTAPIISVARATHGGTANQLSSTDIHRFVFSEAMRPTTAAGRYTVAGAAGGSLIIKCSGAIPATDGAATCAFTDQTLKTMEITIQNVPAAAILAYPLTITAVNDMSDTANNLLTLTGSDTAIDVVAAF